jgi:TetR/AcrR family transcriptional regulator, transcriptional repressor for nem operon
LRQEGIAVKVSREQVKANRTRILDAAARLLREEGFDKITLAGVMGAAGLTHGAFYGHFDSREALIDAAIAHPTGPEPPENRSAAEFADAYLSRKHRDARGTSCPVSSLGTEAARASDDVRRAMTANVRKAIERLSAASPGATPQERRQAGIAAWSAMVGAIVIARLVDDEGLADDILEATRAKLNLG